jgi:hypothetical protein
MTPDAESVPTKEGAPSVTYRISRDWGYTERQRRLAQTYRWLLDLEPWPSESAGVLMGDAEEHEGQEEHEEREGSDRVAAE